jgi:hypothetical protein
MIARAESRNCGPWERETRHPGFAPHDDERRSAAADDDAGPPAELFSGRSTETAMRAARRDSTCQVPPPLVAISTVAMSGRRRRRRTDLLAAAAAADDDDDDDDDDERLPAAATAEHAVAPACVRGFNHFCAFILSAPTPEDLKKTCWGGKDRADSEMGTQISAGSAKVNRQSWSENLLKPTGTSSKVLWIL